MSTQHWRRGLDRPILMIPGPTEVPWRVIRAMAQPAMIQYEPPFDDEILEPACLDLRQVFQTSGEVIAMPGPGAPGSRPRRSPSSSRATASSWSWRASSAA